MPKKASSLSGRSLVPANIGFRIDDQTRELLGDRIASLDVSAHEWARHCLLTILKENQDREAWEAAVTILHHEINELRKDVALATQVLLVVAGKMPSEKAREWIGQNLKPR